MELFNCNNTNIDWTTLVATIGLILVSIATIIFSHLQFKRTLITKREDDRVQEISIKLNEFYGPLLQLRRRSDLLYALFVEKYKAHDNDFRTLLYLLEGGKFEGNDKLLIEQIIKIGDESINLINLKSGLIDDDYLRNKLIPKFCNHLIILKLAYDGNFSGEKERFKDYVYPLELVTKLNQRFESLQKELEQFK